MKVISLFSDNFDYVLRKFRIRYATSAVDGNVKRITLAKQNAPHINI